MAWDRKLLSSKMITISDTSLKHCFNPWHRESRAYERIDKHITGPLRSLYPQYYGSAALRYSSCPFEWRRKFPDHGNVDMIVLELLDQQRPSSQLPEMNLSASLLSMAKEIYLNLGNREYIHIFIHLCEMVDILHRVGIIHADIKPENLLDYTVMSSSVLFDFSKSWVYADDLPCLDPFQKKPRTFEERRNGELESIKRLVLLYAYLFQSQPGS